MDREPCTYLNCVACSERDWLLAEASDEVRAYFFAIRDAEEIRLLSLAPRPLREYGWIETSTDRCGCSIWIAPVKKAA